MVTSALSGEGKSFTSINLAMSIAAELDHTVMLVDADVARPSVLKVLGLTEAPGLLEVLEGKAEMASAAAHQHRQADPAAQRHAAPQGHRTAGQSDAMGACWTTWPRATPTASSSSIRRRCC
jgi:Mrp family chromosome partitioning ATPase